MSERTPLDPFIAPLRTAEFLERHWERVPFLGQATEAHVAALDFGAATFRNAVRARGEDAGAGLKAVFIDAHGKHRETVIRASQAEALFDGGMTLCLGHVQRDAPAIAALTTALREALDYAGRVGMNAYYSPRGGGFGLHFDAQSVMILQIEGEKTWRYSRAPAIPAPPRNVVGTDEAMRRQAEDEAGSAIVVPDPRSLESTTLRRGSVLYLPAGTWHATDAGEASLSLTLTFEPYTAIDLVTAWLREELLRRPAWRASLPPVVTDAARDALADALAARLDEARALLAAARLEDLADVWQRRLADDEVGASGGSDANDDVIAEIAEDDAFELAAPLTHGVSGDGATPEVWLRAPQVEELRLNLRALPFVRRLATTTRFAANEAQAFGDGDVTYAWDEVRAILAAFLEAGVIRRATAESVDGAISSRTP